MLLKSALFTRLLIYCLTNLKVLIKKSKYKTQDNFAKEGIHVDPTTVRRWIAHGIRDINVIEEIAEILDINFMELFK